MRLKTQAGDCSGVHHYPHQNGNDDTQDRRKVTYLTIGSETSPEVYSAACCPSSPLEEPHKARQGPCICDGMLML